MKKTFKLVLGVVVGVLLIIQLIPKNIPENKPADDNDILAMHAVPENVASVLKASCYDCHSNEVVYPWYSYVVPVNFLITHDVNEGRSELNFSEWGNYETKRKIKKLTEISEELEEGKMPLPIYTAIHRNAKVSDEQMAAINTWAEQLSEEILEGSLEVSR